VVGHGGEVTIAGAAIGPLRGDAHGSSGLRFTLKEIGGAATVPVVYRGSVPDLFRLGRHVFLRGRLRGGVFEAVPDSLVTRCPSKYVGKGKA
jgi:cytochrome c-type biogenesis protein CcmE